MLNIFINFEILISNTYMILGGIGRFELHTLKLGKYSLDDFLTVSNIPLIIHDGFNSILVSPLVVKFSVFVSFTKQINFGFLSPPSFFTVDKFIHFFLYIHNMLIVFSLMIKVLKALKISIKVFLFLYKGFQI